MLNKKSIILSVFLILTGCFDDEETTVNYENLLSKSIILKERTLSASGKLPADYVNIYREPHLKKLHEADKFFNDNLTTAKAEHNKQLIELGRVILDLKTSSKKATGDESLKLKQKMKEANLKKSQMRISYHDKTKVLAENRKNRLKFLNNAYLEVLSQDFSPKN